MELTKKLGITWEIHHVYLTNNPNNESRDTNILTYRMQPQTLDKCNILCGKKVVEYRISRKFQAYRTVGRTLLFCRWFWKFYCSACKSNPLILFYTCLQIHKLKSPHYYILNWSWIDFFIFCVCNIALVQTQVLIFKIIERINWFFGYQLGAKKLNFARTISALCVYPFSEGWNISLIHPRSQSRAGVQVNTLSRACRRLRIPATQPAGGRLVGWMDARRPLRWILNSALDLPTTAPDRRASQRKNS